MHAADEDGQRAAGVLEPAQRRPLTGSAGQHADQHDHPDVAQDRRDPGDDQPGHVQVQRRPQCPGQHESINGQRTPPVLPVVQDRVLVMQDVPARGLEVIRKVVRLSPPGEGQHRHTQQHGGIDRQRQRRPPVAALRDQHQRHADRKKQQRCRTLTKTELTVSHATTSTCTINRRREPHARTAFIQATHTAQWTRPVTPADPVPAARSAIPPNDHSCQQPPHSPTGGRAADKKARVIAAARPGSAP